jgi:hypothetical protein
MSLLSNPEWDKIAPFIYVNYYNKDTSKHKTRFRLEVRGAPETVLNITDTCVVCGMPIHPVRERKGALGKYLAVTCDLATNISCARQKKASNEYNNLRDALNVLQTDL